MKKFELQHSNSPVTDEIIEHLNLCHTKKIRKVQLNDFFRKKFPHIAITLYKWKSENELRILYEYNKPQEQDCLHSNTDCLHFSEIYGSWMVTTFYIEEEEEEKSQEQKEDSKSVLLVTCAKTKLNLRFTAWEEKNLQQNDTLSLGINKIIHLLQSLIQFTNDKEKQNKNPDFFKMLKQEFYQTCENFKFDIYVYATAKEIETGKAPYIAIQLVRKPPQSTHLVRFFSNGLVWYINKEEYEDVETVSKKAKKAQLLKKKNNSRNYEKKSSQDKKATEIALSLLNSVSTTDNVSTSVNNHHQRKEKQEKNEVVEKNTVSTPTTLTNHNEITNNNNQAIVEKDNKKQEENNKLIALQFQSDLIANDAKIINKKLKRAEWKNEKRSIIRNTRSSWIYFVQHCKQKYSFDTQLSDDILQKISDDFLLLPQIIGNQAVVETKENQVQNPEENKLVLAEENKLVLAEENKLVLAEENKLVLAEENKQEENKQSIVLAEENKQSSIIINNDKILLESDCNLGTICRKLAPIWKMMTAEQKQPFVDMHNQDKQRYQREVAKLNTYDKKRLKVCKKQRKQARCNQPKAALTSYIYHVQKVRPLILAKDPNMHFKQIGKELGKSWRNASPEEIKRCEDLAQQDRERYNKEQSAIKIQMQWKYCKKQKQKIETLNLNLQ